MTDTRRNGGDGMIEPAEEDRTPWLRGAVALLTAALAVALAAILATPPATYPGLAEAVADRMALSGVDSPVTAVLLNFRAYDTLLEIGVLALTVIAAFMVRAEHMHREIRVTREAPVHEVLTRVLLPVMLLTSGFLLWAGTTAFGGAFQAGALLGAAGILLLLAAKGHGAVVDAIAARILVVGGFAAFFLVGAAMIWIEGRMLQLPQASAYGLIFAVEAALALSIGGCLALLYGIGAKEAGPARPTDSVPRSSGRDDPTREGEA